MASTITAATMSVQIVENITLNGQQQGSTIKFNIASIASVIKRIITCPASQSTKVLGFSANVYDSAFVTDVEDAKYIRITNLDDTNSIEVAFIGAATLYQVAIAPGQSHILGSPDNLMLAEGDTNPSFGTMSDLATVAVNPGANSVDIEIFAASV